MNEFWRGRKVFVTSPASFRGAWICLELLRQGALVHGYGPLAATSPHLFDLENIAQKISMTVGNLTNPETLFEALNNSEAEVVIHLGSEMSVKELRDHPLSYIEKEVMGTTHLMESLRQTATVRSCLVLSSDKVYHRGNDPFTESSPISAGEIAPTAKLCAEFIATSYREQFFSPEKFNKHKVVVGVARLGAAVAGGDFSEDSLVFQAIQSFVAQVPLLLKKPASVRTWMDMGDQVTGILLVAEHLYLQGPKALPLWNIAGNQQASVSEFAQYLAQAWAVGAGFKKPWQELLAKESLGEYSASHHPVLSSEQMKKNLNWQPQVSLSQLAQQIVDWYAKYY